MGKIVWLVRGWWYNYPDDTKVEENAPWTVHVTEPNPFEWKEVKQIIYFEVSNATKV